jgi:hypothetical protein
LIERLDSLRKKVSPRSETKPSNVQATEGIGLLGLAKTAANLLSCLKAETSCLGRVVERTETAIYHLMASRLRAKPMEVFLLEIVTPIFDDPTPSSSVLELIDALIVRRNEIDELHGVEPAPHVATLLATVNALIDGAVKLDPVTGSTSTTQRLLGSDVCQLATKATRPLLVSLKSFAAGAHIRTRKHVFTIFFTGDKISLSDGAVLAPSRRPPLSRRPRPSVLRCPRTTTARRDLMANHRAT